MTSKPYIVTCIVNQMNKGDSTIASDSVYKKDAQIFEKSTFGLYATQSVN